MTLCNKCKHKRICKHYDYFLMNHDIEVDIKKCENFLDSNTTIAKTTSCETKSSTVEEVKPVKQYPDLKNINLNSELKDIIDEQLKPIVTDIHPLTVEKEPCSRCKKDTHVIDLKECSECGRKVCTDCSVGVINDGKLEVTCEKCWSGEPDPTEEDLKNQKITYGANVETDVWDLESFKTKHKGGNSDEPRGKQMGNSRPNKKSKKK